MVECCLSLDFSNGIYWILVSTPCSLPPYIAWIKKEANGKGSFPSKSIFTLVAIIECRNKGEKSVSLIFCSIATIYLFS